MVNYLARLGWSHGDDELFDRAQQIVAWFDGEPPGAQRRPVGRGQAALGQRPRDLKAWTMRRWRRWWRSSCSVSAAPSPTMQRSKPPCALFKDRCDDHLGGLADWLACTASVAPAARRGSGGARDRRGAPGGARSPARAAAEIDWGQGDRRRHQGDARRARPEDAAAGHAGARAGVRPAQTPSIDAVLALFARDGAQIAGVCRKLAGLYSRSRLKRAPLRTNGTKRGIAQLGERLHGMQEVSGSIPLTSTKPEPAQVHESMKD